MTKFQIGLQMYTVRDRCTNYEDMLACMKQLKAIGYNACQLAGHNPSITAEQIRAMLDESGLTCPGTLISLEEMEENLDAVIRSHRLWNCANPGVAALPNQLRSSSEGYFEFARRANKVAEKLKDNGMSFYYHHHAFEFHRFADCGKTGMEILLENCSDNVLFQLDTFWVQMGGGNPIEWIQKLRGRTQIVHFKEMNGSVENRNVMAPIGAGNLNWPAILKACDDIGVKYAFIEQDNAVETDSIECLAQSCKYLTSIGGRF